MPLLDFIKNRHSQQQSSATEAKPETAKEMYTRAAGAEATPKAPQSLSPDQQAKVMEATEQFRRGTQQAGESPSALPSSSPEGASAQQPMAQMSMNQDKAAPSLSPTSAQHGTPATEKEQPSAPSESASVTQAKAQEQSKRTMARATPSWER